MYNLQIINVGEMRTNCYILSNEETKEALVFDPGADAERILEFVKSKGLSIQAVLLTHGHFDHIMGVDEIRRQTRATVYACEAERELLGNPDMNCAHMFNCEAATEADIYVKDGQILTLAGLKIQVIHTPGHTSGGVCYYIEDAKIVITGDTLFFEAVGRCDLPTSNEAAIIESITKKLFVLPEDVTVYPGHGRSSTIGYEEQNNPYVLEEEY